MRTEYGDIPLPRSRVGPTEHKHGPRQDRHTTKGDLSRDRTDGEEPTAVVPHRGELPQLLAAHRQQGSLLPPVQELRRLPAGGHAGHDALLHGGGELAMNENITLIKTDILPKDKSVIRDDIANPNLDLYKGVDVIYSIRPPNELQPHLVNLALKINAQLIIKPLTNEDLNTGKIKMKLKNYKRASFYTLRWWNGKPLIKI